MSTKQRYGPPCVLHISTKTSSPLLYFLDPDCDPLDIQKPVLFINEDGKDIGSMQGDKGKSYTNPSQSKIALKLAESILKADTSLLPVDIGIMASYPSQVNSNAKAVRFGCPHLFCTVCFVPSRKLPSLLVCQLRERSTKDTCCLACAIL